MVNYNLNKLEQAGFLTRESQVSRGMKLTGAPSAGATGRLRIPVVGTIAAGEPLPVPDATPVQEAQDLIEVTRDLVGSARDLFALHVRGDSMIDALINGGDVGVMQATRTAENGGMVAAWLKAEEQTTLKRFYRENGTVRLQPANPHMQPLLVDAGNVEIQGRVIAVIRNLN